MSSWEKFVELVTKIQIDVEDDVLKRVAEIVRENPKITLSEVAVRIGIDKSVLSRRIQKFLQEWKPTAVFEKLRKELERCRNESTLWEIIAMDAARKVKMYREELYEVLAIMCQDCLLKYILLMEMKYRRYILEQSVDIERKRKLSV